MRWKPKKRPTGRPFIGYDTEEEGYESGGYGKPVMYELIKVRVKVRFHDPIS
jgi:hypothetical protein